MLNQRNRINEFKKRSNDSVFTKKIKLELNKNKIPWKTQKVLKIT